MIFNRLWLIVTLALLAGASGVQAQVQEKWSHIYAGPGDNDEDPCGVGVDALGNCYVAARSTGTADWDFLAGKYDDVGDVEWEIPINGPGDSIDYAQAMLVDNNGNVYITGWTTTKGVTSPQKLLVRVTASGVVDWAQRYQIGGDGSMRDMTFDPTGNIIVVGMSSSGGYHPNVTKFTPDGDSLWTCFYRWTGATGGNGQSVACAPDGSVYFTGTAPTANLDDILTVKMSADGDTLWGRVYDGPEHRYDEGIDLAVDDAGNAYVVGTLKDASGIPDIVVLKYSSGGTLLWDWSYNGTSSSSDEPVGVRLDGDGNVCVGGMTSEIGKLRDFAFLKLSPDGDSLFVSHAGTTVSDYAYAMTIDGAGNMYVTGNRSATGGYDFATIKFDGATGTSEWDMTWDGDGGYDRATRICVGEEDHVYIAGYVNPTAEPDTKNDVGIVAYAPISEAVFEPAGNQTPRVFALHQNSPNPFNGATTIRFDLSKAGSAALSVVNILGQTVLTHRESDLAPGSYSFEWNGRDMQGSPLPSGVYLYRLRTDRDVQTRKMVLLK
ncbi:MAG: SBBP repeat-containing protein [Candidatus Zixiibacteriota bacterium]